jgi:hypothetical protein
MSPAALEKEDHSRDAAFSSTMHGKSTSAAPGIRSMFGKNNAAQQAAVDEYFKHWDNKAAVDETAETRKVSRNPSQTQTPLTIAGSPRRVRDLDQAVCRPASHKVNWAVTGLEANP